MRQRQKKTDPDLAHGGAERTAAVTRRETLALLAAAGTALHLPASTARAASKAGSRRENSRHGGTLRVAMQVQKMDDPATFSWVEMSNQARHIVEYLTMTDAANVTRPMLAESWTPSDDLKTWTFRLRRNVTWHNGEAFKAEHVAWNIRRWLDPKLGSSNIALSTFAAMLEEARSGPDGDDTTRRPVANAIEVLDDFTIRLNLRRPVLSVPEDFSNYPTAILHPSFKRPFWKNPVGTGAFTLKELAVASKCTLKRVRKLPDGQDFQYWGGDVYLDAIHYYHYNQDNQLAALATGEVDAVYEFGAEQLAFARSFPGKILTADTAQTLCCRMRVDRKPFDDQRVRTAIVLAADNRRTHRLVYGDAGATGEDHHVAPVHPDYFPLPKRQRNIERARALLREAGYPDGIDVAISVGNTNGVWQQTMCEAIRNQLKEAGIRVAINLLPASKYWEVWKDVPFGATAWTHRPLGTMCLSLAYRGGTPWNETGYADPQFERLLDKAESIPDAEERKQQMQLVEAHLQKAAIMIQPTWRPVYTMVGNNVHGYTAHPTQYHLFNKVWLA